MQTWYRFTQTLRLLSGFLSQICWKSERYFCDMLIKHDCEMIEWCYVTESVESFQDARRWMFSILATLLPRQQRHSPSSDSYGFSRGSSFSHPSVWEFFFFFFYFLYVQRNICRLASGRLLGGLDMQLNFLAVLFIKYLMILPHTHRATSCDFLRRSSDLNMCSLKSCEICLFAITPNTSWCEHKIIFVQFQSQRGRRL